MTLARNRTPSSRTGVGEWAEIQLEGGHGCSCGLSAGNHSHGASMIWTFVHQAILLLVLDLAQLSAWRRPRPYPLCLIGCLAKIHQ